MLRYIRDRHLAYRVTLIYSNRDRASAALLDELQELERELPGFRLVTTMTQDDGWEGGDAADRRRVPPRPRRGRPDDFTFLVAGPSAMAEAAQEALAEAGVREEHVLADRFSGY